MKMLIIGMRCVFGLVALTTPGVLFGQVVVDTLDWRGYYPLAVGNEWHYTITHWPVPIQNYELVRVAADTSIGGIRHFIIHHRWTATDTDPPREYSGSLTYDSSGTNGTWWPDGFYLLADFGDTVRTEGSPWGDSFVVGGGYSAVVTVGDVQYQVPALKHLESRSFAWSIGLISEVVFDGPSKELSYARIDGVEYGMPVNTSSEDPPVLPAQDLTVGKPYPNPSRNGFSLDLNVERPALLRLRVVDALGRVVWQKPGFPVSTGVSRLDLDLTEYGAGVYFVEMTSSLDARWVVKAVTLP